jgi:hypothetical protein
VYATTTWPSGARPGRTGCGNVRMTRPWSAGRSPDQWRPARPCQRHLRRRRGACLSQEHHVPRLGGHAALRKRSVLSTGWIHRDSPLRGPPATSPGQATTMVPVARARQPPGSELERAAAGGPVRGDGGDPARRHGVDGWARTAMMRPPQRGESTQHVRPPTTRTRCWEASRQSGHRAGLLMRARGVRS